MDRLRAGLSLCAVALSLSTAPSLARPFDTREQVEAVCGKDNVLPLAYTFGTKGALRFPMAASADGAAGVYRRERANGERAMDHLPVRTRLGVREASLSLLQSPTLPARLRELIIVRIGYLSRNDYEVFQHESFARSLGVTEAAVRNMACVKPGALSPREATVIRFIDEIVLNVRPSDAALSAMLAIFDRSQIAEMVATAGMWMLSARMLETVGVERDASAIGDAGIPERMKR